MRHASASRSKRDEAFLHASAMMRSGVRCPYQVSPPEGGGRRRAFGGAALPVRHDNYCAGRSFAASPAASSSAAWREGLCAAWRVTSPAALARDGALPVAILQHSAAPYCLASYSERASAEQVLCRRATSRPIGSSKSSDSAIEDGMGLPFWFHPGELPVQSGESVLHCHMSTPS